MFIIQILIFDKKNDVLSAKRVRISFKYKKTHYMNENSPANGDEFFIQKKNIVEMNEKLT